MDKLYAVITESANYDWWAFGTTEREARNAFIKMWRAHCKATGADRYYWGSPGDQFGDISVEVIEPGKAYMDRDLYR
jgi:hypothetical protein